jgi:hypothetical protein
MAAFGKRAVAGKMAIALRLGRVDKFVAGRVRPVEWNIICRHCFNFTGLQGGGPNPRDQAPAKLAVSAAGINDRSRRLANKPDPVAPSTIDIHSLDW